MYDPYTGTFTQPDPIQGGGANAYGYTNGDPVDETDLSGNSVVGDECGIHDCNSGPSWTTLAKIGGGIAAGVACVDVVTCGVAVSANETLDAYLDRGNSQALVADTVTNVATFGFGGADIALRAAGAPTTFVVAHQVVHTALTAAPALASASRKPGVLQRRHEEQ